MTAGQWFLVCFFFSCALLWNLRANTVPWEEGGRSVDETPNDSRQTAGPSSVLGSLGRHQGPWQQTWAAFPAVEGRKRGPPPHWRRFSRMCGGSIRLLSLCRGLIGGRAKVLWEKMLHATCTRGRKKIPHLKWVLHVTVAKSCLRIRTQAADFGT